MFRRHLPTILTQQRRNLALLRPKSRRSAKDSEQDDQDDKDDKDADVKKGNILLDLEKYLESEKTKSNTSSPPSSDSSTDSSIVKIKKPKSAKTYTYPYSHDANFLDYVRFQPNINPAVAPFSEIVALASYYNNCFRTTRFLHYVICCLIPNFYWAKHERYAQSVLPKFNADIPRMSVYDDYGNPVANGIREIALRAKYPSRGLPYVTNPGVTTESDLENLKLLDFTHFTNFVDIPVSKKFFDIHKEYVDRKFDFRGLSLLTPIESEDNNTHLFRYDDVCDDYFIRIERPQLEGIVARHWLLDQWYVSSLRPRLLDNPKVQIFLEEIKKYNNQTAQMKDKKTDIGMGVEVDTETHVETEIGSNTNTTTTNPMELSSLVDFIDNKTPTELDISNLDLDSIYTELIHEQVDDSTPKLRFASSIEGEEDLEIPLFTPRSIFPPGGLVPSGDIDGMIEVDIANNKDDRYRLTATVLYSFEKNVRDSFAAVDVGPINEYSINDYVYPVFITLHLTDRYDDSSTKNHNVERMVIYDGRDTNVISKLTDTPGFAGKEKVFYYEQGQRVVLSRRAVAMYLKFYIGKDFEIYKQLKKDSDEENTEKMDKKGGKSEKGEQRGE